MTPQLKLHSFLAPLIRQYLDFRKSLGYSVSWRDYYAFRELDHYVLFRGLSRPDQMDETFAANWMFSVPSQSARTKNNRLRILRGLCHYLVRLDLLKANPAAHIPYLKAPAFKPHIYSLEELGALLQEAERWKHGSWPQRPMSGWLMTTLIHLFYACGLRLGEAMNLRIEDIDFDENTLALWKTKFHKERLVPFSPQMANRLKRWLSLRTQYYSDFGGPKDYVFRPPLGKRPHSSIERLFRKLLRRCGLAKPGRKGPRLHDLRHTFAVHRLYKWYQEGHDILNRLPLLSTYMGHASIEATQVYLTICRALLREGDRRFQAGCGDFAEGALKRALKKS